MSFRLSSASFRITSALFGAVAFAALGVASANAESVTKQCAAKWQAAKAASTTGGLTYLQFYSKCSAELKAAPAAAEPAAAPAAAPAAPAVAAPAKPMAPAKPAAPAAAGSPVFPGAVSPTYSSETPGKAIMHSCLDQYKANKATGGNAGLKWIQKGGGYYSECNKKLKG
jgi:hypothetical protein